uniref:Uncharacterized protein n=1 Tax=Anguilla anguilla TaxID=7936 RepID=A0A0E9WRD3_ANGAN
MLWDLPALGSLCSGISLFWDLHALGSLCSGISLLWSLRALAQLCLSRAASSGLSVSDI